MLSKADISELQSLVSRAEECALSLRISQDEKKRADRTLISWIESHTEPDMPPPVYRFPGCDK